MIQHLTFDSEDDYRTGLRNVTINHYPTEENTSKTIISQLLVY